MKTELQHFSAPPIADRHALQHAEYDLNGVTLQRFWRVGAIAFGHIIDTPDFLGQELEEIAVLSHFDDLEPKRTQMVNVEIAVEPGRIVIGGKMGKTAEWSREDQRTADLQKTSEFA